MLTQIKCFLCGVVCVVCFAPRYLLPCTHVMLSQRRAIKETDMYGKSADKFLSLIPECCRLYAVPSAEKDEDNAFWGKGKQQTPKQ